MKENIVVFTGSGISAESGLATFRDKCGLWDQYNVDDVADIEGWKRNPKLVLDFHNKIRKQVSEVSFNEAHLAIAELEKHHNVTVITQNVDDLHERAGSNNVIHLHGKITEAISENNPKSIIDIGYEDIQLGDLDDDGYQLRPNVVWFGEQIHHYFTAADIISNADKLLVVGTSLQVSPAAGLIQAASDHCEQIIVTLDKIPYNNFNVIVGKATEKIPELVKGWIYESSN